MTNRKDDVGAQSLAYQNMAKLWKLPDSLLGGTLQMQHEAADWLPQKEKEQPEDYAARVSQSYLFGGYEHTLEDLTAKPFEKPVTVKDRERLNEFLGMIEDDVDRSGKSLTAFAREVFHEAMHRGLTHVLVDFPRVNEGRLALDQARKNRTRPVFLHVSPSRLLGWRTERMPDGSEVLSQIRIYEETVEPDGDYGEKVVKRVRVYTRTAWEVHEYQTGQSTEFSEGSVNPYGPDTNIGPDGNQLGVEAGYQKVEEGTHDFGEVPLLTVYFKRAGFLIGKPVFENVAQLNLAHFQSSSRQRAYLEFARIGTVALLGFSDDDMAQGIAWSMNRFLRSSRKATDVDVKVIEHSGSAIEAGRQDLKDLEDGMQVLGSAPITQRASSVTATGEARDENRGMSKAEAWVRDVEALLVACYEFAARWLNVELPEDFGVDIFSDFGVTLRGDNESQLLSDLCSDGKLTVETLLRELKRRGVFAENFNPEEELDRLESEGPPIPEAVGSGQADPEPGSEVPEADDLIVDEDE